jgi:hypothetical protein
MRRNRTALVLAAVLLAEAALIVLLPARVPRAVRAVVAAVNAVAAVGLWTAARQRRPRA